MSMIINPYVFGAAPALPGYRFWRLYITAADSGQYSGLAELVFNIAGVRQLGGTALASSFFSGAAAANGFDGNTATDWANNGGLPGTPAWLRYDFGAGNEKEIDEVKITARAYTGQGPKSFEIQSSNDGTTWDVHVSVSGASAWGSLEQRTFAIP